MLPLALPTRRSRPSARRPLLALATAAALALAPLPPAFATDGGSPGRSRTALFTEALRQDPVFVSPSLVRIAPAGEIAALRREVEAMAVPTYVVIAPVIPSEPESYPDRPALLHDRLGRDGIYVVGSQTGRIVAASFGVRTRVPAGTAAEDASEVVSERDGSLAGVRQALREMRTGERPAAAVAAERRNDQRLRDGTYGEDDDGNDVLPAVLAFAGGLVLALTVLLVPHHRRRRAEQSASVGPRLVPADARQARDDGLRALGDLAGALATATGMSPDVQRRYDAASKLLDDRPGDPLALVAAGTLARGGRELLDRPAGAEWRPCFFDPRHGEGTRPTRFRRGTADVVLPACRACAEDLEARRPPRSLADDDVPYWERDTAWARTGMGALDDDLADAVLRGDAP